MVLRNNILFTSKQSTFNVNFLLIHFISAFNPIYDTRVMDHSNSNSTSRLQDVLIKCDGSDEANPMSKISGAEESNFQLKPGLLIKVNSKNIEEDTCCIDEKFAQAHNDDTGCQVEDESRSYYFYEPEIKIELYANVSDEDPLSVGSRSIKEEEVLFEDEIDGREIIGADKIEAKRTSSQASLTEIDNPEDSSDDKPPPAKKRHECELCPFSSNKKFNLKRHMARHSYEKPHFCNLCNFITGWASSLSRHVKVVHSRDKLQTACSLEAETLKQAAELNVSSKSTPSRNYLSSHGMTAANDADAKDPEETRMVKGSYNCKICYDTFRRQADLRSHVATFHGESVPYHCNMCSFRTNWRKNLKNHMNRHLGIKPFSCGLCPYRSISSSHLKRHVNGVHTRNEVFKCAKCPFTTVWQQSLQFHEINHKPYTREEATSGPKELHDFPIVEIQQGTPPKRKLLH